MIIRSSLNAATTYTKLYIITIESILLRVSIKSKNSTAESRSNGISHDTEQASSSSYISIDISRCKSCT